MTTIYVDGDACPVRAETERVATRHRTPVVVVHNGGLRPSDNPLVNHVYVDAGLDVADDWIAARAVAGDVVITADVPLAEACVKAGAAVLQPDGEALTADNVGARRATRDLMAEMRAADPFHQGRGKPFGKAERARFLQALDRTLAWIGRRGA